MSDLFHEFRAALQIDPSLSEDAIAAHRWRCPVCDSSDGLAVKRGDTVDVVAKCHACSAEYAALAEALEITAAQSGCTVEELAEYLGISEAALRDQGWRDSPYRGQNRVEIPYPDDPITGNANTRYRVSLDGKIKFRWRSGAKPTRVLYNGDGLDGTESEVFLVEGESDTIVLTYEAGVTAVGLAGATQWKDEFHARTLAHAEAIYLVVEPDNGGAKLRESLSKSVLRDKVKLVSLNFSDGEYKDVRALYNAVGGQLAAYLKAACESVQTFAERDLQNQQLDASLALAETRGLELEPDLIECFLAQARRRYVGEESALVAVFLAICSVIQKRPVNALIDGVSSAGKSALMDEVFRYFPEGYIYYRTSMSPATLTYTPESFVHRAIAFAEAKGATKNDDLVYLLRSLLSERKLRHEVTVKNAETGEFTTKFIEKPGPTGLVMSTTATWLDDELETRMLRISTDDSPEQTRRVMAAEASADYSDDDLDDADEIARWHALFTWQRASGLPAVVHIPYATVLAAEIPPIATRLRRDFRTLCSFIEAHALLHRATREVDDRGRVIATLDDYAAVRLYLGTFFSEGVNATIPDEMRQTVQSVETVIERKRVTDGVIDAHASFKEIGDELGLDKSSARRRALKALSANFLKNSASRGKESELTLNLPLPSVEEDIQLLPTVAQLQGALVTS